jgi:hypothetical protein
MVIRIILLISLYLTSLSLIGQNKASDFYNLVFYTEDGKVGFYETPIEEHENPKFSAFASNMKGYLVYLISNYSELPKSNVELEELLPDSIKIKEHFEELLNKDDSFNKILFNVYKRKEIPPVHVDSILKKISRFYYVHSSRGVSTAHLCAGINGIKEFKHDESSPYYDAFSFMVIYNDFGMKKFSQSLEPIRSELNKSIPEERVLEIRNKVYEFILNDIEMRNYIIKEYNDKKEYLNFKLVY